MPLKIENPKSHQAKWLDFISLKLDVSLAFEEQLLYVFEVCRLMVKVGATCWADLAAKPRECSGGSVVFRFPHLSMPSTKAAQTSWCLQGLEGHPGWLTKLPRTPRTIWGKSILSPHIYLFKLHCCTPKHLWRGGAQELQPCIQHLEQPLSKKQELLGTSCCFQDCFSFYSMALVWNM